MNKWMWIVCFVFPLMVDATFRQCHTYCEEEPYPSCDGQGQKGEKGDPTKPCNCSALEEVQEKLSKTENELEKTKLELSDLKQKPRDCYDVIYYNPNATSGVYTVFPPHHRPEGIEVSCDMDTDGGGWIVFQNRKDGSVDFYRGWKDYLIGFGNLTNEFWLGLEFIHQLTKYGTYDLRVDMSDFEQHEAYAAYSSFSIGEGPGYMLKFDDYFGDAGDSLRQHLNQKFSTMDNDQDSNSSGNCAEEHLGAWWYNSCHDTNLNGQYLRGEYENKYFIGMLWKGFKGDLYSLKTSSMKIRPNFANYD